MTINASSSPQLVDNRQLVGQLTKLIFAIDRLLSAQLSDIIQHAAFKQLEASWLSLQQVIALPFAPKRVMVKLLDCTWSELGDDIEASATYKQSYLYRKLYAEEFDTAGGIPFGLLVIDHYVSSDLDVDTGTDDLYLLQRLSEICEVALCPAVLGIKDDFLGDDLWRYSQDHKRVARILASADFRAWQNLRAQASSRFIHLVLPHYLLRPCYQHYPLSFDFSERQQPQYGLWGNPAYLLAENVVMEFERINWFGFLRVVDPELNYGAKISRPSKLNTKADIFAEDDRFWAEQGLIPISHIYLTEHSFLLSNQSVWKLPANNLPQEGMLQTTLMVSRFGHYLKKILRDKIGGYSSVNECRQDIEHWLSQYASRGSTISIEKMAEQPLVNFSVEVIRSALDENQYLCKISLQPQYQYEALNADITFVTPIGKLGGK